MCEPSFMHVMQRDGYLADELRSFQLGKGRGPLDIVHQIFAAELLNKVNGPVLVNHLQSVCQESLRLLRSF